MHVVSSLATIGQGLCLLLLGLLAGSMFGIRFGYDITQYSPGTFVEVHPTTCCRCSASSAWC